MRGLGDAAPQQRARDGGRARAPAADGAARARADHIRAMGPRVPTLGGRAAVRAGAGAARRGRAHAGGARAGGLRDRDPRVRAGDREHARGALPHGRDAAGRAARVGRREGALRVERLPGARGRVPHLRDGALQQDLHDAAARLAGRADRRPHVPVRPAAGDRDLHPVLPVVRLAAGPAPRHADQPLIFLEKCKLYTP
ncbi:PP135 [Orf virus]|uniref:PP135 n=1 Tax=Orf virus TaxID=10258 RepID=F1AWU4_ORFV|nr:PP135 [Orf virus]